MSFRRLTKPLAAGVFALHASPCLADDFKSIKLRIKIEECREAVVQRRPGPIIKLEYKLRRARPVYEFEVAGDDGTRWELECDGYSGKLLEEEREVASPDDPLFAAKRTVDVETARRRALERHPGTIVETEYEIEGNGDASYEFDIRTAEGRELKVEVDAASGRIVEDDQEELYQIGVE